MQCSNRIPPALSVAEAVLWLRRAALAMSDDAPDAEMMRSLASFLQTLIRPLEAADTHKPLGASDGPHPNREARNLDGRKIS
jgi:hypothetical protein